MVVDGFDWDAGNLEKCQKHGLTPKEIESVFNNKPSVAPNEKHTSEEIRFSAVGVNQQGRYVFIVFTYRQKNGEILIRPISAGYMHKVEIDYYEKQAKE